MPANLAEMNVADLVTLWKDTDDVERAAEVVTELRLRLRDDPENTAVAAALEEVAPGAGAEPGQVGGGPQTGGGEPSEARTQGEQTWLVQREDIDADAAGRWIDVGEITVPPRTKRRTIVEKALAEYPAHKPSPTLTAIVGFRVLDADSAAGVPVRWEVPPAPEPQLVIG